MQATHEPRPGEQRSRLPRREEEFPDPSAGWFMAPRGRVAHYFDHSRFSLCGSACSRSERRRWMSDSEMAGLVASAAAKPCKGCLQRRAALLGRLVQLYDRF